MSRDTSLETNTEKKGYFMPEQLKPKVRKLKSIPEFKNEESERQFWESPKNNSTEYFDISKIVVANFANLKPLTICIQQHFKSQNTL